MGVAGTDTKSLSHRYLTAGSNDIVRGESTWPATAISTHHYPASPQHASFKQNGWTARQQHRQAKPRSEGLSSKASTHAQDPKSQPIHFTSVSPLSTAGLAPSSTSTAMPLHTSLRLSGAACPTWIRPACTEGPPRYRITAPTTPRSSPRQQQGSGHRPMLP